MNEFLTQLRQKKQLYPLFLMAGFIVFAVIWFSFKGPDRPASNWTPAQAQAEADFEPNATNVSPSMHTQLESLRKRVVNEPEDTTHVFRLARLLQDAHKPDEAASYYRHYLALHPENYQAWLDMTQCYGQAEMWDEAEKAVKEMLVRYPEDASAMYNLGAVYANLSRMEEAQQIWHEVINLDKDPAVTMMAQGALLRIVKGS